MNAYRNAGDPFDALGDATRRTIVEGLRDGERTVGDLAAGLPVSRPAVSQHLGVLRAAGLVVERPQGTRRYYRLDPIGLVRLQGRIEAMWGIEAPGVEPVEAGGAVVPSAAGDAVFGLPPASADETISPGDADPGSRGERKKHKKKRGRK